MKRIAGKSMKMGWGKSAVIAIVLILVVYTWHMAGRMGYFTGGHTTSMEVVDIMLDGEVHLRIPKAYLTQKRNWDGGNQEVVTIEAVLPDMRPRLLKEKVPNVNIIYIDLMSGSSQKDSDPSRDLAQQEYSKTKEYISPIGHGLEKVDSRIFEDKKNGKFEWIFYRPRNDYYFLEREEIKKKVIQCEKGAGGNCRAYANFGFGLSGSYGASENFIPEQWQEIDKKVVSLIGNFVVQ